MRMLEFPQLIQQPGAEFLGPLRQPLLFENLQCGAGDGARQGMPAVGAAVTARTEHAQDLLAGYDRRHRVCSTRESLAQDQHIRLHVLGMAGKEMPGAAEPGLNFVCCEQHAFPAADRRGLADKTRGRDQDARFALDRLEQERTRVRSDGTLQRLGVTERNRDEAWREGSKAVLKEAQRRSR